MVIVNETQWNNSNPYCTKPNLFKLSIIFPFTEYLIVGNNTNQYINENNCKPNHIIYFFSYFSDQALVIPTDVNMAATAVIYCAIPLKSVCIVCSLDTSTNNTITGTISNNIPAIVTDTKKKFLELTPVLFCISFNK